MSVNEAYPLPDFSRVRAAGTPEQEITSTTGDSPHPKSLSQRRGTFKARFSPSPLGEGVGDEG